MTKSIFLLLLCQCIGEAISRLTHLPLPGPVLGMALLSAWLLWRPSALDIAMEDTARGLLRTMGLFFVPAGLGIVANLGMLRSQWLPVLVGLVGSTLLSLVGTAWLMDAITRYQHSHTRSSATGEENR